VQIDFLKCANIVKELGGLGLLLVCLLYGLPKVCELFMGLAAAVDRNTRMLYHLGSALGASLEKGSDIIKEIPKRKGE
jgi:hypothetical protein